MDQVSINYETNPLKVTQFSRRIAATLSSVDDAADVFIDYIEFNGDKLPSEEPDMPTAIYGYFKEVTDEAAADEFLCGFEAAVSTETTGAG